MTTKTMIYEYKIGSRSAKELYKALGFDFRRNSLEEFAIRANGQPSPHNLLIVNWGCNQLVGYSSTLFNKRIVINPTKAVGMCNDKLRFFDKTKDKVRVPEYTAEFSEAMQWGLSGIQVMGRLTHGSCGKDIVFNNGDPEQFANSHFWVKYKKKKAEFRVHVMDGEVLFVQKKVLRATDLDGNPVDKTKIDFRIRNHSNGFIFQRNDVVTPADVVTQAKAAIAAVGLDFGAVDVIWNESEGKAYVLEINTAPGLEGTSILDYTNGLKKLMAARDV